MLDPALPWNSFASSDSFMCEKTAGSSSLDCEKSCSPSKTPSTSNEVCFWSIFAFSILTWTTYLRSVGTWLTYFMLTDQNPISHGGPCCIVASKKYEG